MQRVTGAGNEPGREAQRSVLCSPERSSSSRQAMPMAPCATAGSISSAAGERDGGEAQARGREGLNQGQLLLWQMRSVHEVP